MYYKHTHIAVCIACVIQSAADVLENNVRSTVYLCVLDRLQEYLHSG